MVDCLLGMAVLGAWLAVAAALRCRNSLDKLHATTFVVAGPLLLMTVAAVVQDGLSSRALNIIFLMVVQLFGGAAVTFATARAIALRSSPPKS